MPFRFERSGCRCGSRGQDAAGEPSRPASALLLFATQGRTQEQKTARHETNDEYERVGVGMGTG